MNSIDLFNALSLAIAAIAALVSAYSAVYARLQATLAAEQSSQARTSHDASSVLTFFISQYSQRTFVVSDAVEIEGQQVQRLRVGKAHALKLWLANSEAWYERSQVDGASWHSVVAHEMALALQHIGIAAFTGLAPLNFLLVSAADAFVDDWVLCSGWVGTFRAREQAQIYGEQGELIDYHRRHGEWLAIVSALWLDNHWTSARACHLLNGYGGRDKATKRAVALCAIDAETMPMTVVRDLKKLVGITCRR